MTSDLVQEAQTVNSAVEPGATDQRVPVLEARSLVKTFGRVVGLDGVDLQLYPGEVLAIIGDNGAGKSTLIKCITGALSADAGELLLDGEPVNFKGPLDSREAGIENMSQAVETLSGGQRQAVAVARAAAFASKLVILDEPTAALGVKESGQVLNLIREVKKRGLPVILISHNMPHVFEVADRIHVQRLGRSAGVITPQSHTMSEAVAIMTGAATLADTPGRAS
jgi:fructose transport system ATP-binding protein